MFPFTRASHFGVTLFLTHTQMSPCPGLQSRSRIDRTHFLRPTSWQCMMRAGALVGPDAELGFGFGGLGVALEPRRQPEGRFMVWLLVVLTSVQFLSPGEVPYQIDHRKKCTLILTSLLEDLGLVGVNLKPFFASMSCRLLCVTVHVQCGLQLHGSSC